MSKYFSWAIFFKEWRENWWVVLLFILSNNSFLRVQNAIEQLAKINSNNDLMKYSSIYFEQLNKSLFGNNIILLPIMLAGILTGRDKYNTTLNGLPFRKDQIIFTKWLFGAVIVAIPIIFDFTIMITLYYENREVLRFAFRLLFFIQWLWLNLFIKLLLFSFFILILSAVKDLFIGTLIGLIIINLPIRIATFLYDTGMISFRFVKHPDTSPLTNILFFISARFEYTRIRYLKSLNLNYEYDFRFLVLLLLLIILLAIIVHIYKNIDYEKSQGIAAYTPFEKSLRVLVSLWTGLFLSNPMGIIQSVKSPLLYFAIRLTIIFIFGILTYIFINLLIDGKKVNKLTLLWRRVWKRKLKLNSRL